MKISEAKIETVYCDLLYQAVNPHSPNYGVVQVNPLIWGIIADSAMDEQLRGNTNIRDCDILCYQWLYKYPPYEAITYRQMLNYSDNGDEQVKSSGIGRVVECRSIIIDITTLPDLIHESILSKTSRKWTINWESVFDMLKELLMLYRKVSEK